MNIYGLIGFPLSHSSSPEIFSHIFRNSGVQNSVYRLFPFEDISFLPSLIKQHPSLKGLNVTIPYKKTVIPYLDEVDPLAEQIGAVNVIKISTKEGKTWLKGYNSDVYGFETSFKAFIEQYKGLKALILGSGGSSLVVQYVLGKLKIPFKIVSRNKTNNYLTYSELDSSVMNSFRIIINTTPLGMFPDVSSFPDLQYQFITSNHFLFDLIYNPSETTFLKKGIERGASVKNGSEMLQIQAGKAWEIWNER